MPSLIKFKEFLNLSLQEQKELQQHDFSDWEGVVEPQLVEQEVEEDRNLNKRQVLMKKLEKMLSKKDWYFTYSDDGASYRKGREEDDEINDLMKTLGGSDSKKLYDKYAKKAGFKEHKNMVKHNKYENVDSNQTRKTDDYMNPQTWFPDMHPVKATGSLNMGEAADRIPDGKSGRSYLKQDLGWDNL